MKSDFQNGLTGLDQSETSQLILEKSQSDKFPVSLNYLGLNIIVHKNVFSPLYFNGWKVFTKKFPDVKNKIVLEIGCGVGITSIFLAKNGARKVIAMDISKYAVANTKENINLNNLKNIEVRESNIFENLGLDEKFHTIYWNPPFIYKPNNYKYKSVLERGIFDPGYKLIERFLREGKNHLFDNGRIIIGLADFAALDRFHLLVEKFQYNINKVIKENSTEGHPVQFHLYELKPF